MILDIEGQFLNLGNFEGTFDPRCVYKLYGTQLIPVYEHTNDRTTEIVGLPLKLSLWQELQKVIPLEYRSAVTEQFSIDENKLTLILMYEPLI